MPLPWCTSQSTTSTRSSAVGVERVARGDGDVVEQAEAHRPVARRVVAGRAVQRGAPTPPRRRAARRRARPRRRPRAAPPPRSPGDRRCRGRACRRPRAERLEAPEVGRVVDGLELLPRGRRRGPDVGAEPPDGLERALHGDHALDPLRDGRRCRARGTPGGGAGPGAPWRVRYPSSGRRRPRRPAPGGRCRGRRRRRRRALHGAHGGPRGARVALVSATPLAQTASYWAQGGIAAALAADDSAELHREDTERAGRGLVRRSAAEILVREAPGAVEELERLGVRLRRRPPRQPRARPRGRALAPARRPRRRQRHRPAGGARPLRARRRPRGRHGPGVDPRGAAVDRRRPLRRRGLRGRPGGAGARRRAVDRRHRGAVGADDEPARLAGHRPAARPRGRRRARGPRAHAVPPHRGDRVPGREGFLVTEAVRGEGATLLDAGGARFVEELAPRDEVARAIWDRMAPRGRTTSTSTCARSTRRSSRTSSTCCAGRAWTRSTSSSRWPPRRTTGWAGSWPASTARRRSPASSRSARRRARGCTGPTAWPRTR